MRALYTVLEQIRTNFWWRALSSRISLGSQFRSSVSQFRGWAAAISYGSGARSKSYGLWIPSCFCLCTSRAVSTVAILVQTVHVSILWSQNPQPCMRHRRFRVSALCLVFYLYVRGLGCIGLLKFLKFLYIVVCHRTRSDFIIDPAMIVIHMG